MQDTLQDQALYVLHPPEGAAIPLVCDSPHSGVRYPGDFGHAVPRSVLRAAEEDATNGAFRIPPYGSSLGQPSPGVDANGEGCRTPN